MKIKENYETEIIIGIWAIREKSFSWLMRTFFKLQDIDIGFL